MYVQRTDLMDTKEWVHKEIVRRLRLKTPQQRFRMVLEASEIGLKMHRAALDQAKARKA